MSEFISTLSYLCENAEIDIKGKQLELMYEYHKAVVSAPFNLTSIKEEKDSALKHFFDSIIPYKYFKEGDTLIDVGCGGGFPCVPLAVMRNDITITGLDSNKKKCDFIKETCKNLGIKIKTINARSEECARNKGRESYDVCVTRAVASLNVLLELCVPLIKPKGFLYAYKGDCEKEIAESKNAQKVLGVKIKEIIRIPQSSLNHNILVFEKIESTKGKYPRNFSAITKKPL